MRFPLPLIVNTQIRTHSFTTSAARLANRAVVFAEHGSPSEELTAITFPSLSPPAPRTVNIRYVLSPINPSDINVIEGVYPLKPEPSTSLNASGKGSGDQPVRIVGNEGLAQVVDVGDGVTDLKKGDWVVMGKQQLGTWTSAKNVGAEDVLKIPKELNGLGLGEASAATMTVNPATAYNMLHDFVDLKAGDWVIQNGANSAVGQAVIQVAASRGLNTINLVRNREDIESLKTQLKGLGATHVLTYDELSDKSVRNKVNSWSNGEGIRLGLNCVSGKETGYMARLLGQDAHLVSYGAMSKQPLSLPTSLFIFKNLTCHGFWQSVWYKKHSKEETEHLMKTLVKLMVQGKLKEPDHEVVTIHGGQSDEEAEKQVRDIVTKMAEGRYGKKVLIKIDETVD